MGNSTESGKEDKGLIREMISKFGFASLLTVLGLIALYVALSGGQNTYVILGLVTVILCAVLIAMNNSGVIPLKFTAILIVALVIGSVTFAYLNYDSVQNKLEFIAEQEKREDKVVQRLMDIRKAQVSFKKLYGEYAGSFDALITHVKNDSMPVVKAIGFVPDSLTEAKAVELGIVTRDTLLISVRDTLFPTDYFVDSLRYVPFSDGQEFELQAGEIEKNKLLVKVFQAFASNDKILNGMNLSEEFVDLDDGLMVGSMTDPHTRGNWE